MREIEISLAVVTGVFVPFLILKLSKYKSPGARALEEIKEVRREMNERFDAQDARINEHIKEDLKIQTEITNTLGHIVSGIKSIQDDHREFRKECREDLQRINDRFDRKKRPANA